MKEVASGIRSWSVFSQEKGISFNGHLVVNDEGCVLVDPPPMSREDLDEAGRLGPPSAVIITNRHHTRDAATPARRWSIPILLHKDDSGGIPPEVTLGGVYRDGDRLAAGLVVVTLADQKSPGESALVCAKARAVILGDALIGKPAGSLSLLPAEKYKDIVRAKAGLRQLLEYQFEALLVGDGASILKGGRRAVEEFLASA